VIARRAGAVSSSAAMIASSRMGSPSTDATPTATRHGSGLDVTNEQFLQRAGHPDDCATGRRRRAQPLVPRTDLHPPRADLHIARVDLDRVDTPAPTRRAQSARATRASSGGPAWHNAPVMPLPPGERLTPTGQRRRTRPQTRRRRCRGGRTSVRSTGIPHDLQAQPMNKL
jgi:hypothetical protein